MIRRMLRLGRLAITLGSLGAAMSACATPTPSAIASVGPTGAAAPAGLVVGCASIESIECHFVAGRIAAQLPAGRGPAFSIQIHLFGCANGAPCPPTLAAREGRAVIEYADAGEPIVVSLHGPRDAPRIAVQQGLSWSELVQPTSPLVPGPGPFPFELGHCGLSHVVDFDGSFWVPVGPVDGDASGMLNGESGRVRLLGQNLALYEGPTGFSANLARFPGPKRFFLCD
jgi:hypothetical protein